MLDGHKRFITALSMIIASTSLSAQRVEAQEIEVPAFTVPRILEAEQIKYPIRQATNGEEGLVRVNFMVDTDGRAFDPVVADSVGSKSFSSAALAALEATVFQPAMRDGEPIVGSSSILYRFEMSEQSQGASQDFAGLYGVFQRALDDGDKDKLSGALRDLDRLGAKNRYENAYLDLARYQHALSFGTELEQMTYLRGALSASSSPDDPVYLDAEIVRELRRLLLPLQLRNNYFPYALDTYELMQAEGDDEAVSFFADSIAKVKALEFDETEYSIPLQIGATGDVATQLFKHNVAVTGGAGELVEMSLHCDQKYIAFQIERDVYYGVPPEWGECFARVIGDADAEFLLLQR